jgi:Zn-dependent protease
MDALTPMPHKPDGKLGRRRIAALAFRGPKMTSPSNAPGPWGSALAALEPNVNRSISPTALSLLAIWIGIGAALGLLDHPPRVLSFAFVICGWILALSVHEFCHAWVADKAGDTTVEGRGYLTLNPLKYADPIMSIVVPVAILAIGGIGFPGGAVYLRPDLMRGRLWRSAASLAGPGGTLGVLLFLAALLAGMRAANLEGPAAQALAVLAYLQATALVINLMPIPGFDGYGVLRPFIPPTIQRALIPVERFAALAFIGALLWFQPLAQVLFGVAEVLCWLLGVEPGSIVQGLAAFQFWK